MVGSECTTSKYSFSKRTSFPDAIRICFMCLFPSIGWSEEWHTRKRESISSD
eukprot:CAMPEP_0171442224 /NCGR_PEP_ID=MMETSP0881-20121228/27501_1 /TAXON_ID=67004 /ORGANISM="Thalassiosira weissflogii, Strain CCMP1336" /LENGTH=51 /DNA_ID=CAMNT_0011965239 /DNA_START=11 /DNA_END=163 /DNA_ORIENTATION=-